MKVLTYHGDETIIRLFTTTELAVAFAKAEVAYCSDSNPPTYTPAEMQDLFGWGEHVDCELFIMDNDWGDQESFYTVRDVEVDLTYKPE